MIISSLSVVIFDIDDINEVLGNTLVNSNRLKIMTKIQTSGSPDIVVSIVTTADVTDDVVEAIVVVKVKTAL